MCWFYQILRPVTNLYLHLMNVVSTQMLADFHLPQQAKWEYGVNEISCHFTPHQWHEPLSRWTGSNLQILHTLQWNRYACNMLLSLNPIANVSLCVFLYLGCPKNSQTNQSLSFSFCQFPQFVYIAMTEFKITASLNTMWKWYVLACHYKVFPLNNLKGTKNVIAH